MNALMRGFDPFDGSILLETLDWFYPTLIVELLVIGIVAWRRWGLRRQTDFGRRLRIEIEELRRWQPALAEGESGWWVLPIFCWSFQGVGRVNWLMDFMSSGLTSPPPQLGWEGLYTIGFSLAALVVVQSVAVRLLSPGLPRLGVSGGLRTAAHFAMISVILNAFLNCQFLPR